MQTSGAWASLELGWQVVQPFVESYGSFNLRRYRIIRCCKAELDVAAIVLSCEPKDVCFILHKFIPTAVAAWARAAPDRQLVLVDSLWGLPDGLQFLSHDTFEYDVRRHAVSSERLRYKPYFLQETESGDWRRVRVASNVSRHRSITASDLREVAERTRAIAVREGRAIQVMWFCEIDPRSNAGRNIPWFMMTAPTERPVGRSRIAPGASKFVIRDFSDLSLAPRQNVILELDPEAALFRDRKFIPAIAAFARENDLPIAMRGSVLGHAFYLLEREGVQVVSADTGRTRTRQRQVFRKLVRDEIPARIAEQGEKVLTARIAKSDTRTALVIKLYEEAQELLSARQPADITAELADLFEVVRGLCQATGMDWDEVQRTAEAKRKARGSFDRNVVLLETSWPAWKAPPEPIDDAPIELAALAQVMRDGAAQVLNYAAVARPNAPMALVLSTGQRLSIALTAKGVEIREIENESPTSSQLELPLL